MIIRKHYTGNEFIRCEDVLVRNFTKTSVSAFQLISMFDQSDYSLVLRNQELNKNKPKISDEIIYFKKVVIISDGYDFEKRHLFLNKLPKNVGILATNKSLLKWKLMHPSLDKKRSINAFIVNNPYKECNNYLPSKQTKYYPVCIASIRTDNDFIKKYMGDVYTYYPTPERSFGIHGKENYYIDDYRNPICASIGLAYHFGAEQIMLLCCDNSFKENRNMSVKLENGLYTYPQHLKSQRIIDTNLYWLSHQKDRKIEIADYSSGAEYKYAKYISNEEDAINFFEDKSEGSENGQ